MDVYGKLVEELIARTYEVMQPNAGKYNMSYQATI